FLSNAASTRTTRYSRRDGAQARSRRSNAPKDRQGDGRAGGSSARYRGTRGRGGDLQGLGGAQRETVDSEAGRQGSERDRRLLGKLRRARQDRDAEMEADVLAPQRQGDGGAHPPRQDGGGRQRDAGGLG